MSEFARVEGAVRGHRLQGFEDLPVVGRGGIEWQPPQPFGRGGRFGERRDLLGVSNQPSLKLIRGHVTDLGVRKKSKFGESTS